MLSTILIGLIFAIFIVWGSRSMKYRRIRKLFELLVIVIIVMVTDISLGLLFGVVGATGFFLVVYVIFEPLDTINNGTKDN